MPLINRLALAAFLLGLAIGALLIAAGWAF
jgi:hypothetical protein